MFNLTNKSKEYLLNIFNTKKKSDGIKEFCKAEYGSDWLFAYTSFKTDGRFPNTTRRNI
tara:strand:- start:272 stop:448 length:177 start_codon:yes stop_codon:yes gene_type:complete